MLKFEFTSIGKFKLLVSRLAKISSIINVSIVKDKMLFVGNMILVECCNILKQHNQNISFSVNTNQLNEILAKLSAKHTYSLHVSDTHISLLCLEKSKLDFKKSKSKVPIILLSDIETPSVYDDIQNTHTPLVISVNEFIWSLQKFQSVFDNISLRFNQDELFIFGEDDDFSCISQLNILSGNIEPLTLKINSSYLLSKLWLLEFASCNLCCFIDPNTLLLNMNSESKDCKMFLSFKCRSSQPIIS